jgi:hypothetical protein
MLDRSPTANLFSEHAQEADELAGVADAAVERAAASPVADLVEAQRDASPSTAPPSARPRRPRPNGGGRRGAVRSKPPVTGRKPTLSLPAAPPYVRSWRRARWFAPAALLVPLLLILVADPAGSARQATRTRTSPAAPAAKLRAPLRTHEHGGARAAQVRRRPRARPIAPAEVTSDAPGTAPAAERAPPAAATAPPPAPAAPAMTAARPISTPASPPAAANSGSPPREESVEGDEFGFER